MDRSAADDDRPRVGWFGGSFDPPHHGHLRLALEAAEALRLSRVLFVPVGRNPHKPRPPVATPVQRRAMVAAAIASEPRFDLEDCELADEGPSWTVSSLGACAARHPDRRFVLLLGADAWAGFGRWRDPLGILAVADVAVAGRPDCPILAPAELPGLDPAGLLCYDGEPTDEEWTLTTRPDVQPAWRTRVRRFPTRQLAIASSAIRDDLTAGRSVRYLLPDAVLRIMTEQRIYAQ